MSLAARASASGALAALLLAGIPCVRAETAVLSNGTAQHRYDRAYAASIRIFQQATGVQLALVMEPRLPAGRTIQARATELFEQHGLGRGTGGNAILLLWSQAEGQFRIEVSYGLEGVFPDLLCHQLEAAARAHMLAPTPYAQRDFLAELMVTMRIHYLDSRGNPGPHAVEVRSAASAHGLSRYLAGGGGAAGRDYAGAMERAEASLVTAQAVARFAPQASARGTLDLYLQSLQEGVAGASLPLLTQGSQYLRLEQPRTASQARRIAQYQRKAAPMTLWQADGLAVAIFQPGHPVLPVFLRRDATGLWRVDEAKGPAYFELAEQGGSPVSKYGSFPFAAAWPAGALNPLFQDRAAAPPLDAGAGGLAARVRELQERAGRSVASAQDLLALAEVLHFEMYWLDAAAPVYERALALAPGRDAIRWRLLDVYINTSDIDAQERMYRSLLERSPGDALAARYSAWFRETYPPASR